MIRIRGGSGIGDSLYVQAIARHLVRQGKAVEACSNWPDVFWPLQGKVRISSFRRENIDLVCHYTNAKDNQETDQFRDCCRRAGLREPVELRLDWTPRNADLIGDVRRQASGRPIVLVQLPRTPMGRTDGFGAELLPDCRVIQRAIDMLGDDVFVVQVGKGEALFKFDGIALDLANRTSVSDLIDLVWAANGCLGYCSFIVPLAESLRKPLLLVWSRRGLQAPKRFISSITPRKVIHYPDLSHAIIDDCQDAEIVAAARRFREQICCAKSV